MIIYHPNYDLQKKISSRLVLYTWLSARGGEIKRSDGKLSLSLPPLSLSLSLSGKPLVEEIPAYGSSIKSEQAPRWEREREREHAGAEASNGVHTSRREYTRDSEEGDDDSEGTLLPGLACPALLYSAPLRVPCPAQDPRPFSPCSLVLRSHAPSSSVTPASPSGENAKGRQRTAPRFSRVNVMSNRGFCILIWTAIEPSSPIWNILVWIRMTLLSIVLLILNLFYSLSRYNVSSIR